MLRPYRNTRCQVAALCLLAFGMAHAAETPVVDESACRHGDGAACWSSGSAYAEGRGAARDPSKAEELLLRGCWAGNSSACIALGWLYETGATGARSRAGAYALYRRACAAGDADGCRRQAVFDEEGRGTVRAVEQARASYRRACDAGDGWSCRRLAWLMRDEGNDEAAVMSLMARGCAGETLDCARRARPIPAAPASAEAARLASATPPAASPTATAAGPAAATSDKESTSVHSVAPTPAGAAPTAPAEAQKAMRTTETIAKAPTLAAAPAALATGPGSQRATAPRPAPGLPRLSPRSLRQARLQPTQRRSRWQSLANMRAARIPSIVAQSSSMPGCEWKTTRRSQ